MPTTKTGKPTAKKPPQTGRDLAQSIKHLTIDGVRYELKFNNKSARIAEDVYANEYGRDIGYYGIMDEAANKRHSALMAIYYGALVAGGSDMSWEEFDEKFKLAGIGNVAEVLVSGLQESLPTPAERKN